MQETSERLGPGSRLYCRRCGTEVRLERVGGGRMECCDQALVGATGAGAAGAFADRANPTHRARCTGCGNEVTIERDGGGRLECCNEEMVRA
jgi:desulfoferrodoxin-like iron-binding protein